jgi:prepilin signal peptidase PulO-like enzyme (type II secretory pathway)
VPHEPFNRFRAHHCIAAPLPLYSTFIMLSGYTYGAWMGAVISYFAALSGAVCVYTLCRTCFRKTIASWLSKTTSIKRVVRAIEKRPKLLFMVRLAPYPYNVMNALLAASPTLTFKTYTLCTALSLFKVIIHTTIGASIHSFAGYHLHKPPSSPDPPVDGQDPASDGGDGAPAGDDDEGALLSRVSAIVGIVLCVAIIVYLSWVARKAVDEELDDDEVSALNPEETELFLDPTDNAERGMGEVSFARPLVPVNNRSSFSDDSQLRLPISRTSVSLDDPWSREEQSSTALRTF